MRVIHEPTEGEAVQYDGVDILAISNFVTPYDCAVVTFHGSHHPDCEFAIYRHYDLNSFPFKKGDWIIRRPSGCVYVCSDEAFQRNWRAA